MKSSNFLKNLKNDVQNSHKKKNWRGVTKLLNWWLIASIVSHKIENFAFLGKFLFIFSATYGKYNFFVLKYGSDIYTKVGKIFFRFYDVLYKLDTPSYMIIKYLIK